MNPETLLHFGLHEWPFSKEIPDDALWLPPSKAPLVDAVCDAVVAHQSVLLTGDAGAGKTCVLRAVRNRLTQPDLRLTYCHNATLGRRDFYRQLCVALNLNPKATAAAVFHAVSTHVEELGRDRIYPVFLLDEAHLLHQDTLDHLHILLNYEWDSRALLSLVLVGLPELEDRLTLRRNRSLFSRLGARVRIDPLTPEDTADYIRARLGRVGKPDLFTADALALLYEAALGNLRDTDRVATWALVEAARLERPRVERDLISRVLARHVASQGAVR
jgi:type II secretory pathway predicted ATPase ExeA